MATPKRGEKPEPPKQPELRLLPTQIQIGDRFTTERGEWRVIGRPYSAAGGKNVYVRAELTTQPGVIETHLWGAHERIAARRG